MAHLNRGLETLQRDGPLFMATFPKNPVEAIESYPTAFTFSLLVAFFVILAGYLLFSRSSTKTPEPEKEVDEKPDVTEDDDDKTVQDVEEIE